VKNWYLVRRRGGQIFMKIFRRILWEEQDAKTGQIKLSYRKSIKKAAGTHHL